jgi:PAS domain S-box-containing protein
MGIETTSIPEQPHGGSRSIRSRVVPLAVFLLLAASAVGTFEVTRRVVRDQEDRLLRDQAGEVEALLTTSFSSIESSLRVLGNVGASLNPAAAHVFTYTAEPLVEAGTATIGVAAEREGTFTVVAAVGDGPAVGTSLQADRAALATRALAAGKMVSALVVDEGGTRLVLAVGVGQDRSVIYQESMLDPTTPIPSTASSPFHRLRVVLYASSRPDPASLVLTTEAEMPLTGSVERIPFEVGADHWLLAVSAREPLVGSFARNSPWILLFGGLITALLAGAVAETLARRRAFAIAMVADRTADLREANEELAESRQFVDSIIENIPNMVFVKSADDLRFVRFNKAGEELLGYAREDLIGKNDYDFFTRDEADHFTTKDREVLEGRRLVDIPEEPIDTKDGARILHTKKIPILDDEGLPRFLLGISEDITERKEADRQLHEAKEEAERANRAKDEFLSRMSHELRTPLNAVLGFGQLLQMGSLDEAERESVKQILRGGRHLLGLIDEVLDIARISTGQLSISQEPVSVASAIKEAVELVRPIAAEREISFHEEAMNGFHVLADRQRLKQVLLNLLSNGVKYNGPGGSVSIFWEEVLGGRLRINVRDTGPGIPPEAMERLFLPFDRLGAEASAVEGTGLGLALSKGLVDAMGGTLSAESVLGTGSVFSIELQLTEAPIDRYERGLEPSIGSVLGGRIRTILYIEDNPSNLELVERVLATRPGLKLISAMQGSRGIELARDHRPDVILLDLHLPDMSGEEVLRALREDPATEQMPIVVITADATRRTFSELFAAGADDFLTKPLDVKRLIEVVESVAAEKRERLDRRIG